MVIERAATEVFAEYGYHATTVDRIAQRAGISVPVLYDHFASKSDLHRQLMESHYADLRAIWLAALSGAEDMGPRLARALGAWFGYIETHPSASRMLFQNSSGNEGAEAIRRQVATQSRELLLPLFAHRRDGQRELTPAELEMAWEGVRGAMQAIGLWWSDHDEVSRAQAVSAAMNAVWIGLERAIDGPGWNAAQARQD